MPMSKRITKTMRQRTFKSVGKPNYNHFVHEHRCLRNTSTESTRAVITVCIVLKVDSEVNKLGK